MNRIIWLICTVLSVFCTAHRTQAGDAVWTVSSGMGPENANPPWGTPGAPHVGATLTTNALRLETPQAFSQVGYFQEAGELSVPTNLVIEARMKFISGTSSVPWLTSAGIMFYASHGVANFLWIGRDEIFVNSGNRQIKGASAVVD